MDHGAEHEGGLRGRTNGPYLVFLRHGQAQFLSKNYDSLSKIGRLQIEALAYYWIARGLVFGSVYCGSHMRHRETSAILELAYRNAGLPWPQVSYLCGLKEIPGEKLLQSCMRSSTRRDAKNLVSTKQVFFNVAETNEKQIRSRLKAAVLKWMQGELTLADAETWPEFLERVSAVCSQLIAQQGSSNSLAITSGGPIAVVIKQALLLSVHQTHDIMFQLENASFSEFSVSSGTLRAVSVNRTPHVRQLALHSLW
jgi:broad specificity phosphatase PhoE